MVDVQNFPIIIIEHILKYASDSNRFAYANWANGLPLLSVSKNWRRIGMPIIYKTMFAASKSKNNTESQDRSWLETTRVDRKIINSNIDLVHAVNAALYTKTLVINTSRSSHFNSFICTAIAFSYQNPDIWSHIQALDIQVGFDDYPITDEYALLHQCKKVKYLIDSLTSMMWNIKSLQFLCQSQDRVAQFMCSSLVNCYSDQLHILKCPNAVSITTPQLSSNLTTLYLTSGTEAGRLLPIVCAKSLVSLKLLGMPFNFSWKYFQVANTTGNIVFSELTSLELSFNISSVYDAELDDRQWRLNELTGEPNVVCFPKLKSYKISNNFDMSDIGRSDIFPKHLDTLELKNSIFSLENVNRGNIKSVDRLTIHIPNHTINDEELFYKATNYALGKMETKVEACLDLGEMEFALNPKSVEWKYLTVLNIYHCIDSSMLPELLKRLPKVHTMSVLQISANQIENEDREPDDKAAETNNQFAPCLKTLRILGLQHDYMDDAAFRTIKYILMKAVSLRKFECSAGNKAGLRMFIARSKRNYKHLRNLVFSD